MIHAKSALLGAGLVLGVIVAAAATINVSSDKATGITLVPVHEAHSVTIWRVDSDCNIVGATYYSFGGDSGVERRELTTSPAPKLPK